MSARKAFALTVASIILLTVGALYVSMRAATPPAPAAGSLVQSPQVVSRDIDWSAHNRDVSNSRYSDLDQINAANVDSLKLEWSVVSGLDEMIHQVTPIVLDGIMYFNSGSKLYAVNAETGAAVWTHSDEPPFPGSAIGRRGSTAGNGIIYSYGGTGSRATLYAVDSKTGDSVKSFGSRGRLMIADAVVRFKYPDKDPDGYEMAAPPTFYGNTLYVGLAQSEKSIAGGLLAALDANTGSVKWVFNTVPQSSKDEGWDIAKDTWVGGGLRTGGGMWTTPAIDPDMGLVFVNAGNPFPDYAGNMRKGVNLFTNSVIAVHMQTGKLAWYSQTIHHDLWDWDLVTGPVLFDARSGNEPVKGVVSAGKNCLLYIYNRQTGEPLNPLVEMPVSTVTDVPGEEPWPTQPFPYTASGVPMRPFCSTFPMISDLEIRKRARPIYTPYSTKELYIVSHGGSSFGSPSFSPKTGLLYVTGKNAAISVTVRPADRTRQNTATGTQSDITKRDNNMGVTPTETVTAYEPISGEVAWQSEHRTRSNIGSAGSLVTAGDLVFQGSDTGEFYALSARSGTEVFKYVADRPIKASPMTYRVKGRQYVTIIATNAVLTFAIP